MATPPPKLLFFYGTLMHPHVLYSVLAGGSTVKHPESYEHVLVTAKGYIRYSVKGKPYPGMVKSDGSVVGVVTDASWLATKAGISVDEVLKALDQFEGDSYLRVDIQIGRSDGSLPSGYSRLADLARHPESGDSDSVWDKYANGSQTVTAAAYEWAMGLDGLSLGGGDWNYDHFVEKHLPTYLGEESIDPRS
ncbi:hypothetical protein BC830DRAFT_396770 [Chytriomyces sp. MP71]|nr:hypothetical protein BC830DRAFT_396770 [Chytriomyces sp. MP71]